MVRRSATIAMFVALISVAALGGNSSETPPVDQGDRVIAQQACAAPLGLPFDVTDISFAEGSPVGSGADSAIARGEHALRAGDALMAEALFADAILLAERDEDLAAHAAALGGRGLALAALGRRDTALESFNASVELAQQINNTAIEARSLYNASLISTNDGTTDERSAVWFGATRGAATRAVVRRDAPGQSGVSASARFDAAAERALTARDFALAARAYAAASMAQAPNAHDAAGGERLRRAAIALSQVSDSAERINAALAVGDAAIARAAELPRNQSVREPSHAIALEALTAALQGAIDAGDMRLESYARGLLGRLYGLSGRADEARLLTEQAAFMADQSGAAEALFLWQGQLAALHERAGRSPEALAAYQNAARSIERVRPALARGVANIGAASSRDLVEPILLAYTDLLLRQGDESALRRARAVVEQLKTIQLERFFEDACVAGAVGAVEQVEEIDDGVAIVYPIIFPDRVDLIVSTNERIWRRSVEVAEEDLERSARAMRSGLRHDDGGAGPIVEAQALHGWLIAPIGDLLEEASVHTIVFVPDGVLNGLPIAALHDGSEFLIERYAVATAMGLSLFDPRPFADSRRRRAVLAGITDELSIGDVQFSALPSVAAELASASAYLPGRVLLNNEFSVERLTRELSGDQIAVVHLATHAQFGGNAEDTFLLAQDVNGAGAQLTLDDLEMITASTRIRGQPIELLTLSACETAVGDDNATLGLAGVAFKAGARAVLASLWQVSDASTAQLTPRFYRALIEERMSKAQALREAQLELLRDPATDHPFHWSAFILVGNWL